MKLSTLTQIIHGELKGANEMYAGISINTRTLQKDNVYIAIKGDRFDGHQFVLNAKEKGAAAAIVSDWVDVDLPQICVKNTREALMQIASHHRAQFDIPVIGITGSCGKTTTRAMLENILSQNLNVLASIRSYNNDIGVPLTLLQLSANHDCAVIEMGANHQGEIAQLTEIVKPTVAILTCAAKAHLAGFGSLKGVSIAKGEIFSGLPKNGIAVINADDQFAHYWKKVAENHQVLTFGRDTQADIQAQNLQIDAKACAHFSLLTPKGSVPIELKLLGAHHVTNALAAASGAFAINIPLSQIQAGLNTALPVSGRLVEKKGYAGATIIDDSYNANPTSVLAAIDLLVNRAGESVLVLGDMLELGDEAEKIHQQMGEQALAKGLSNLYAYGPLTKHAVNAFGKNARHFDDRMALMNALKATLTDQTTVLVKGSNSMGMRQVVDGLIKAVPLK